MDIQADILLISGENSLQHSLRLVFESANYHVIPVMDITEAVSCLQKYSFRLIFWDIQLLSIDQMILAQEELFSRLDIPTLIFSPYPLTQLLIRNRVGEKTLCILKPLSPQLVLNQIEKILKPL